MNPLVTEKAVRPASKNRDECFYCGQKIGNPHKTDCVLLVRKWKVRLVYEVEVMKPFSWGKDDIDFHYNGSSTCADSFIREIEDFADKASIGCLCPHFFGEAIEPLEDHPTLDEG